MTFVAGGALKPIGGHILSHSSATRMFLRKGKSSTFPACNSVIHRRRVSEADNEYPLLILFN
jgi:RecA/RadA recombinase